MIALTFNVAGTDLRRTDMNKLVAVNRNNVVAKFKFDTDWEGVTPLVAQFSKDDDTCYDVFIENGECIVPWEVLESDGVLTVTVFGGDLITTSSVNINVYGTGLVGGLVPTVASPSVYSWIVDKVKYVIDLIEKAFEGSFEGKTVTADAVETKELIADGVEVGAGSITLDAEDETLKLTSAYIMGNGNTGIYGIDEVETKALIASSDIEAKGSLIVRGDASCQDLTAAGNVYANMFEGENISLKKASTIPEIKNSFSTSTYSSVDTDLKFNSSGFDLKAVSTKASNGSVYTNEIKTSNSKITVNANDYALNSATNETHNITGKYVVNANNEIQINRGSSQVFRATGSGVGIYGDANNYVEADGANVRVYSSGDTQFNTKNERHETNGTYEVINSSNGGIIRLIQKNTTEARTTKAYLGTDNVTIGVDGDNGGSTSSDITAGIVVNKDKVNVVGRLNVGGVDIMGYISDKTERTKIITNIDDLDGEFLGVTDTGYIDDCPYDSNSHEGYASLCIKPNKSYIVDNYYNSDNYTDGFHILGVHISFYEKYTKADVFKVYFDTLKHYSKEADVTYRVQLPQGVKWENNVEPAFNDGQYSYVLTIQNNIASLEETAYQEFTCYLD